MISFIYLLLSCVFICKHIVPQVYSSQHLGMEKNYLLTNPSKRVTMFPDGHSTDKERRERMRPGIIITRWMKATHKSTRQAATACGMAHSTFNKIRTGDRTCRYPHSKKIAEAMAADRMAINGRLVNWQDLVEE